jgi:hypothetical protein
VSTTYTLEDSTGRIDATMWQVHIYIYIHIHIYIHISHRRVDVAGASVSLGPVFDMFLNMH